MIDDRMRLWEMPIDARWSLPVDYDAGVDRNRSLGDMIVGTFWVGVFAVLLGGEWVVRKVRGYR